MSRLDCPEGYSRCPYEKAHIVADHKMAAHIQKCKASHPDMSMSICPYNSVHVFPDEDMKKHMQTCPDKIKLETFLYQSENTKPLFPVIPMEIESSECWDTIDVPTYNPAVYYNSAPLLQSLQGAKRSERKKFRQEQRQRLANYSMDSTPHQNYEPPKLKMPLSLALSRTRLEFDEMPISRIERPQNFQPNPENMFLLKSPTPASPKEDKRKMLPLRSPTPTSPDNERKVLPLRSPTPISPDNKRKVLPLRSPTPTSPENDFMIPNYHRRRIARGRGRLQQNEQ